MNKEFVFKSNGKWYVNETEKLTLCLTGVWQMFPHLNGATDINIELCTLEKEGLEVFYITNYGGIMLYDSRSREIYMPLSESNKLRKYIGDVKTIYLKGTKL